MQEPAGLKTMVLPASRNFQEFILIDRRRRMDGGCLLHHEVAIATYASARKRHPNAVTPILPGPIQAD